MKNRIMIFVIIGIFIIAYPIFAQNTNPEVSNVAFSISGITVTVTYDVSDVDVAHTTFTVYMEVSSDGGTTWNYNYGTADGDIGASVAEGTGKTITWTYQGDYNPNFMVKILADDLYGDQIYYAGQIYNTITIGTQTWLKENLNVGTMIGSKLANNITPQNQIKSNGIEKYCYGYVQQDNAAQITTGTNNCAIYGGLYQWNEAMQYAIDPWKNPSGHYQGICPTGWHIPTFAEFQALETYVNDEAAKLVDQSQSATAYTPTNETGFSALFAGIRDYGDGSFHPLGYTHFWSSYESAGNAYSIYLYSNNYAVGFLNFYKNDGFSVRCLKD